MNNRSSTLIISPAMPAELVARYIKLYDHPVGYQALKGTESFPESWKAMPENVRNQLESKLETAQGMITLAAEMERKRKEEEEKHNAA